MADISLKEYLQKVEAALDSGERDEVIHHCRHILRYYPKNAAAYRYMAQALLEGGSLDEAHDLFRRVLSVYPDDYVAHIALSEVNERRGRSSEAIWHLERAFEQNPASQPVVEKLRELYRRYRQVDQGRLQLTAGAVARQYLRNGLHDQAIETLQTALHKSPNRADLRLLLARTLWAGGMDVEGAETALEVLRLLPDCLEANEILARLWLKAGRPSDAQRFLNRVEAVDPYLALSIAQNNPPPDEAFSLPELDYGGIVRRRLQTDQPDWLADIDTTSVDEDWMSTVGAAAGADTGPAQDFDGEVPEDWLLDEDFPLDSVPDDMDAPAGESIPDLFDDFDDGEALPDFTLDDAGAEGEGRKPTGVTGLLAALDRTGADDTAPPDNIPLELPDAEEPDEMPLAFDFDEDQQQVSEFDMPEATDAGSLAWGEEPEADFAAAEPETEADDPFAWMQQSQVEFETGDSPLTVDAQLPDSGALRSTDADDPLAWMRTSGVEMADPDEIKPSPFVLDEEDMTFGDVESVDPFAWMQTSGVEILAEEGDQPLPAAEPNEAPAATDDAPADMDTWAADDADEEDPFAWLQESGVEISDEAPTASVGLPDTAPAEDDLNWMRDESLLDEALDLETLTDTGGLTTGAAAEALFAETPSPDEMEQMEAEAALDDVTDFESAAEEMIPAAGADQPEYSAERIEHLRDGQNEMSDQNDNDLPDWLNASSSSEEDGFDWLSSAEEDQSEGEQAFFQEEDENALDWMAELPSEEMAESAEAGAAPAGDFGEEADDRDFGWLAGDLEAEEAESAGQAPDWMTESESENAAFEWLSSEADDEGEAEPLGETPDWLQDVAPVSEWGAEVEEEAEHTPTDEQLEWLSSEADDEGEAEPLGETPDWLQDVAPVSEWGAEVEEEAEHTPTDEQLEWLSSEADDEGEAEPLGETPDWLQNVAPVSEWGAEVEEEAEHTPTDEQLEWLSSEADEEGEAEPLGETPDWLQNVAPVSEWGAEVEEEAEHTPTGEQLEWLASDEVDEGEAEFEYTGESGEQFEWQTSGEAVHETEPSADQPDWLADVAELQGHEEAADEQGFDWESQEVIDREPEWLADVAVDDGEDQPESAEGRVPAWLADAQPPEEEDAADWADEAEPAYDVDASHSTFGWLGDLADEQAEAETAEEPQTAGAYDQYMPPDTLMQDEELSEAGFSYEAEGDSDEIERILATSSAPPPADNAPDWLNAMVPGLDLDYSATDEALVEEGIRREPDADDDEEATRDFAWLVDIVREETGQVAAVHDESPASPAPVGRFSFRRLPAWLRRPTEQPEKPSADDEGDFELPDWLR